VIRSLRDLGRRKLRTTLTVAGITIGIWALVVFGSMANKINSLVEGGSRYFEGKIVVSDASGRGFAALAVPMSVTLGPDIAALAGVDVVVPTIDFTADEEFGGGFGQPDQVSASVAGADEGRESFPLTALQGRLLTADDEGRDVAVLGQDIARKRAVSVGGTVDVRGTPFEVVGILEPTLTAPDTTIFLPLEAGQRILHDQLPAIVRDQMTADDLASSFVVYPVREADPEVVADAIEAGIPNTATLTGESFDALIGSSVAIFNAIIVGVGLISLVVGGLSVINTMAMSVAERTREIGIKRAIGGSRGRIVRELMIEAGLIGFIGGVFGLGLGALVVYLVNEAGRSSGTVLFELTLGTAISSVAFSTILGVLAGVVPALHAARLDPVDALRYE
jgi:putative ABC transport system permease protein